MLTATDPALPPARGKGVAWAGGIAGAAAGAALAWLPPVSGAGASLWRAAGLTPASPVPGLAAAALAFGFGLAAAALVLTIQPTRKVPALLAALIILTFSQSLVLAFYGWQWSPWAGLLSVLAGGGCALLLRPPASGPAALFHGRLSPARLATLEKTADLSCLRPDQREATVLTCRLLNENALREKLPARDFLKLCETFRSRASALLLNYGACLDPAEPNGVRAFFGLPLATAAPADEAVRAALALDDAMQALFVGPTDPATLPVCGIGLVTGILTAGVTGAAYTVLGDAVELSRWLALQNSSYQTRLLIDAATHRAAEQVEDRPLEFLNPPEGAAVEIFHLLGTAGSLSAEGMARRNAFRDAIMLLRAGHAEDAVRRFENARAGLVSTDPVLEYFIGLAQEQVQRDAASHPQKSPAASTSPPSPIAGALPPRRSGKTGRKLPRRP